MFIVRTKPQICAPLGARCVAASVPLLTERYYLWLGEL